MRIRIFLTGAAVIALGIAAARMLEKDDATAFMQGALTLGGGLLICGFFSLKMKWHGIIGGGVLGLLGAARGAGNLPDLAAFLAGDHSRGTAPLFEFGITVACLVLLISTLAELGRERIRRLHDGDAS
jgi:hypothetical protein